MGHQYISASYRPRYRPSRDLYKDSMLISPPPRKLIGLCQQTTSDPDSTTPSKLTELCQQTTSNPDRMTNVSCLSEQTSTKISKW